MIRTGTFRFINIAIVLRLIMEISPWSDLADSVSHARAPSSIYWVKPDRHATIDHTNGDEARKYFVDYFLDTLLTIVSLDIWAGLDIVYRAVYWSLQTNQRR